MRDYRIPISLDHWPWILLGISVVGVVLQLVTLFIIFDPNALFWADEQSYYRISVNLAEGQPFSTEDRLGNLGRAPAYPFLLSLIVRLTGPEVVNLRLFQVILFPFFLGLLFFIGFRWQGLRIGLIAAALATIYPFYVYIPLTLYPQAILIYLFVAVFAVMLLLREQMSYVMTWLLGGLIAAAIMVRPTAIVLIPAALFFLLWKQKVGAARLVSIILILLMVPGAAAVGWMARNKIVHDSFTFSPIAGTALLSTYSENAVWNVKEAPIVEEVVKRLQTANSLAEKQKIIMDEVRKFVSENPGKAMQLAFLRCLNLWNPIIPTMRNDGAARIQFKVFAAIPYIVVLVLGIGGLFVERKSLFAQTLILLMILNTILNGIFMVSVRYRVVTDFALILGASICLNWLYCRLQGRKGQDHVFPPANQLKSR